MARKIRTNADFGILNLFRFTRLIRLILGILEKVVEETHGLLNMEL